MEVFKRLGLDIAKKDIDIPKWQQDQTMKRMQELDEDPGKAIDFDDMLNRLEEKHGLKTDCLLRSPQDCIPKAIGTSGTSTA